MITRACDRKHLLTRMSRRTKTSRRPFYSQNGRPWNEKNRPMSGRFSFLLMNQWKSRNNDFDPEFRREISHQQGAAQPHFQQTTINCGKVSINRLLATFNNQGPEILDINEQNGQKAANKRKHGQRREKKRGTGSRWQRPYVHFGCKGGRDFMLRVVAAKVSP